MDEIVRRAIAKWPDVPSVFNWLALDRRGNWLIKGERISNPAVVDFIGRNYEHDQQGRWFFQNGPQRVFVDLAYTPIIYRMDSDATGQLMLRAHTGTTHAAQRAWMDEAGNLLIETPHGIGLLEDRDLPYIADQLTLSGSAVDDATLEQLFTEFTPSDVELELRLGEHSVRVSRIRSSDVPRRFGFNPQPRPASGEPEC